MFARPTSRRPWPARVRLFAARGATLAALAVVATAPVGCTHNPKPDPNATPAEDSGPTTVRVQNQGFLDVRIYVVRGIGGGVRSRLGTVTGNSTAVLTIPKTLVQPATQLRFIATPIGGNRGPISQEIVVSPGDEVGLLIPPQ